MDRTVEARLFKGTRDVLPGELMARNRLVETLAGVFERYGFAPLETPAIEYLDILLGKYGAEGEKLIYKLAYRGGEVLALRYDLTVPLSRVVAMHPELPLPWKRYQIQPVWRADRPQLAQGRYREFIQCDVDTVGTASMAADAENVAVVHDGILATGIKEFRVRVNDRKVLRAMVEWAGIGREREADVLRIADKLDKIGLEGVRDELAAAGFARDATGRLLDLMQVAGGPDEVLGEAARRLQGSARAEEGIAELRELLEHAAALGLEGKRLVVDLSLTRGLDYYTGPVYEVVSTGIERFGSLAGGGRYDDLMGLYGGAPVPATGVSIGLSRVLSALQRLDLLETRQTPSQVLVMRLPQTPLGESLRLCAELRAAGVPCEAYYEPDRLKKQFQLAERKGIPFAAILGPDELKAGTVNLKNLATGEQTAVPRTEVATRLGGGGLR